MPTKAKKPSGTKKVARKPAKAAPKAKAKAAPAKAKAKAPAKAKAKAPAKAAAKAKAPSKVAPKGKGAAKAAGKGGKGKGAGKEAAGATAAGASPKRKLGLRGAAPWAARHAAKHAAEARARAAEPAPPGSARATLRVPSGADQIKVKIGELYNQTQRIRTLRKRLDKSFHEIGRALGEIQANELYQAKGFGSFDAFLEREIELGKAMCHKLIKVSQIFQQEPAIELGLDRVLSALSALDGETVIPQAAPSAPGSFPGSRPALPLKPPSLRMLG
jgi:hypothetical protein